MPPRIQRGRAQHEQVAGNLKRQIIAGDLPEGARLPVRLIEQRFKIGHTVAQDAHALLKSWRLIRVTTDGTFVTGLRAKWGPQQRLHATTFPPTEHVEVLTAKIIPAPEYVIPILHLRPSPDGTIRVLRREWVSSEHGDGDTLIPAALTVTWNHPAAAEQAPELLTLQPLPNGAHLIAGRKITGGWAGCEARPIEDDGREAPLLNLPLDAHVLGEVWEWWAGGQVIEYGESARAERRVIEWELEP